jgi:hypothetical protein
MFPATVIKQACARNGVHFFMPSVFTDHRQGYKRVKVWFAHKLFTASQKQQRAIDRELRAEFGDKFISAYFIKRQNSWRGDSGDVSFCVRLKK